MGEKRLLNFSYHVRPPDHSAAEFASPTSNFPPTPPSLFPELNLTQSPLRSIRSRILVPLFLLTAIAALAVATGSAWLGSRRAEMETQQRYEGIRKTLQTSSFPLSAPVLRWLADLTDTELVTYDEQGRMLAATLAIARPETKQLRALVFDTADTRPDAAPFEYATQQTKYTVFVSPRRASTSVGGSQETVAVFFNNAQLRKARWQAASLPLVTGLSTVLLLGTMMLFLTNRLVKRIQAIQQAAQLVAGGKFDTRIGDRRKDELGQLGDSFDTMAEQLKQLWATVQQQQSTQLLHQIAGGMAHQLRNSLTGARIAIELHLRHTTSDKKEELEVAIQQIEQVEQYVQRLLTVGSSDQQTNQPQELSACFQDIQSKMGLMAQHHQVEVNWDWAATLESKIIADGPTFTAAITNLILNAIQVAPQVNITAQPIQDEKFQVTIRDRGPGIPAEMESQLFDLFATSKPEGLGLGLPLVQRAADHLGGEVSWRRDGEWTEFTFTCPFADKR
ncbi:Sensor histidine kinase MtrB [Roseimaritima multifibrata]|uniref:histidine kinase n=1 Tax=Roseimaritima multifibrata TaxID=1930274 RepID=A0A517MP78_9BACT|nr:Sensor histidine kinase MtrB [Roseimaritima multifibrata]